MSRNNEGANDEVDGRKKVWSFLASSAEFGGNAKASLHHINPEPSSPESERGECPFLTTNAQNPWWSIVLCYKTMTIDFTLWVAKALFNPSNWTDWQ